MKKILFIAHILLILTAICGTNEKHFKNERTSYKLSLNRHTLNKFRDDTAVQSYWTPDNWNTRITQHSKNNTLSDLNRPINQKGWTPLMYAVAYSSPKIVEQLLQLKDSCGRRLIDIDTQNQDGTTALAMAIFYNNIVKVKLLLKHGSNVWDDHFKDNQVILPATNFANVLFQIQPSNELIQITRLICDQANHNSNLLCCAGFCELINKTTNDLTNICNLLQAGAYINCKLDRNICKSIQQNTKEDSQGQSPLMLAIRSQGNQKYQVIQHMLKHPDIDITIKDTCKLSALILAIRQDDPIIVSMLTHFRNLGTQQFHRINETSSGNTTGSAFHCIISRYCFNECCNTKNITLENLKYIIRAGLDLSVSNIGTNILMDNIILGDPMILSAFLSERSFKHHNQILGLLYAQRYYKLSNDNLLYCLNCTTPIDINNQSNELKLTPLMQAIYLNYEPSAKLLLDTPDIQIHLKDIFGHTALWYAATQRSSSLTTKVLNKYNANPPKLAEEIDEPDVNGDTLWDVLSRTNQLSIMELILDYLPQDQKATKEKLFKHIKDQILQRIVSIIQSANTLPYSIEEHTDHIVIQPADHTVSQELNKIPEVQKVKELSPQEKRTIINQKFQTSIDTAIEHFKNFEYTNANESNEAIDINSNEENPFFTDVSVLLQAKDNNGEQMISKESINQAVLRVSAEGYLNLLKLLLQYEPNVYYTDKEGNTSLMLAAKRGHYNLIPSLIQNNKNLLNKRNNNGETALTLSAIHKQSQTVRMLVQRFKARARDINQALEKVNEKLKKLYSINKSSKSNDTTNKAISDYKAISDILKTRVHKPDTNQNILSKEKIETHWPIFFSNNSATQLKQLQCNEKETYAKLVSMLYQLRYDPFVKYKPKLSSGIMSSNITHKHRLVYDINGAEIHVISCKDHYYNNINKKSRKDILKGVLFNLEWKNKELVKRTQE